MMNNIISRIQNQLCGTVILFQFDDTGFRIFLLEVQDIINIGTTELVNRLVIITDNRNPLKTLPWIIVLVFAPVVGLVFYFFFGQNLSKRRIISRRTRRRITMQLEEARDTGRPEIPEEHRRLAALLYSTTHSVALYGSRITPYTDGRSKMEALLAEIARAKHHIHIQYYIFCDDETGRRLRDALVE